MAAAVSRSASAVAYIHGDEYWSTYPGRSFAERVSKTNQDVLAALRDSASSNVICEWVPCRGVFVEELYDICITQKRLLLHVILTAPISVLRSRKRRRDGDEDIGPEVVPDTNKQNPYSCLIFDTTKKATSFIADEIAQWILSLKTWSALE